MQKFVAFMFYAVVHWHKCGEVDTKYILQSFYLPSYLCAKIIKIGKDLTKLWQYQFSLLF